MAMEGRGRLSNIELLPPECGPIVSWAADALNDNDRTQTDIYAEFYSRLEALKKEYRGELEFKIPSFSAFNRYSINLAKIAHEMNETRRIASALAEKFDPEASDDVTLIAAEAIKSLVMEMMTKRKHEIDPRGAQALGNALRAALSAQAISTDRRKKIEKEFAEKAKEAVSTVGKARGLSDEAAQEILSKILGVEK